MRDLPADIQRRINLQQLADHLDTVKKRHFDMRYFETHVWWCGTVACAAGHGPLAGIPFIPQDDGQWGRYTERAFTGPSYDGWSWMFSSGWKKADDTPQGAAARIRYFLQHGNPENVYRQMEGWDPMCYRDNAGNIRPEYGAPVCQP